MQKDIWDIDELLEGSKRVASDARSKFDFLANSLCLELEKLLTGC